MGSIRNTDTYKALLTIKDLNEQNRRFWNAQADLLNKRMADELLYAFATMDVRSEALRQVPIYSQKSLEQALADAEKTKNACQAAFSRKGGSTPRRDALQRLIQDIVLKKRDITEGELVHELKGDRGAGIVTRIDGASDVRADEPQMIHFVEENEMPRRAHLSGLKDRLFRAKKKISSR